MDIRLRSKIIATCDNSLPAVLHSYYFPALATLQPHGIALHYSA